MNNHGSGQSNSGQGNGGLSRPNLKNGMDFNLTQPIQLSNSINQGSTKGSQGNFGVTQPSLQKILRGLSKQNAAAHNSNGDAVAGNERGTQSTKSMSGVSQRKSSSKGARRIDVTAITSAHGQNKVQSTMLNKQLGDNVKPRGSRNPRNVDGSMPMLAPPSQSNTIPVIGNPGLSFNSNKTGSIGPTMGTESGGGVLSSAPQTTNSQTAHRSQSGKRLQRSNDSTKGHSSNINNNPSGKLMGNHGKYISQSSTIPTQTQGSSQQDTRFAQRPHKLVSKDASNYLSQTEPSAPSQAQVLHSEPVTTPGGGNSSQAKYFSQRIQNQIRSKGQEGGDNGKKQQTDLTRSKDELLRAFINPANKNGTDSQKLTTLNADDSGSASDQTGIKGRIQSRSQGKAGSGLNEIGGLSGASLEKIQAKVSKIKDGHHSGGDDKSGMKGTLSQAATSFRAKLLRNRDEVSNKTDRLLQKTRDEPQIIQNALNSLKKSLNKQSAAALPNQPEKRQTIAERRAAEEARKQQEEKNLGPDDIVEYRGMKMTVSQREEYMEMEEEQITKFRQNYYPAKFASKKNGVVVTYAANTHQGMVRNYNEDRVSIILNIIKPKFKNIDFWPRCSFFAIYDGHGGAQCADFLRDQLHQMIVRDPDFPQNPVKAMQRGFEQAEKNFLEYAHNESNVENGSVQRSGSCAIVVLIVGEIAYIANVGDSRAFMSIDNGTKIVPLSIDHKPELDTETERIEGNGGKVYQNTSYIPDPTPQNSSGTQTLIGPHRVFPGRLSVSRTIGDIEAKDIRYGGNPNVVIAIPEIRAFKIKDNYDFIIIGCDGVFEKLDNQTCMDTVWEASLQPENLKSPMSLHSRCGASVDGVLNECVNQKTLDNITSVIIGFNCFEKIIERARTTGARNDKIRESMLVAETVELDWEQEMIDIEEADGNKMISKLMKPLEPVEEEMIENSELETPLSEVIEVSRKKTTSKTYLTQKSASKLSHNSSVVSDRYASSSRRQSQLIESQDTQNLIDHDLLNDKQAISIRNSRTNLHTSGNKNNHANIDQSQNNAPVEEEQAGIGQRKSATQIGVNALQQSQQPNSRDSGGEQGSTKNAIVQRDYKIRQTSVSPGRVQRQNSDRVICNSEAATQSLKNSYQQPQVQQQPHELPLNGGDANKLQAQTSGMGLHIPTYSSNQNQIPQTKQAKTPLHPSKRQDSRNQLEAKNNSIERMTNKAYSQRPITPKRVVVPKKPSSQQLASNNSNELGRKQIRDQQFGKELIPNSAGTVVANGGIMQPARGGRRKEDLKIDDVTTGKLTKKMISNWVGGNQQQQPGNALGVSKQNSSFQNGANTSKNIAMGGINKSYISASGLSAKSNSKKNRTQRMTDTIQNLINVSNSSAVPSHAIRDNDLAVEQADLVGQFNSFNGNLKPPMQEIHAKSGSNPPVPRQRKKMSAKNNLTNKSMRVGANSMRQNELPQARLNDSDALSNGSYHLPQTTAAKNQRTSASRNVVNNLQPSIGGGANQGQMHNSQQMQSPGTANITLNFNQINLTTGSNRAQHHMQAPQISSSNFVSATAQGTAPPIGSSAGGNQATHKQWYSNTINLSGIKQISATVLKQGSSASGAPPTHGPATNSQTTKQVIVKRLRD